MNCKIVQKDAFYVLEKVSTHTTAGGKNQRSVPDFWEKCRENGTIKALLSASPDEERLLGICYEEKGNGEFDYSVAVPCKEDTAVPAGFRKNLIPARTWARFECVGAMPYAIQQLWHAVYTEYFPQSEYRPTGEADIEVYPDGDGDDSNYRSELWIAVEKK